MGEIQEVLCEQLKYQHEEIKPFARFMGICFVCIVINILKGIQIKADWIKLFAEFMAISLLQSGSKLEATLLYLSHPVLWSVRYLNTNNELPRELSLCGQQLNRIQVFSFISVTNCTSMINDHNVTLEICKLQISILLILYKTERQTVSLAQYLASYFTY